MLTVDGKEGNVFVAILLSLSVTLRWEELPPLPDPVTVTVLSGGGNIAYSGCNGITISDELLLSDSGATALLHEYGHVWECQVLTPEDRAFISACMDLDCSTPGRAWRDYSGFYYDTPAERWAQGFASMVTGRSLPYAAPLGLVRRFTAVHPPFDALLEET